MPSDYPGSCTVYTLCTKLKKRRLRPPRQAGPIPNKAGEDRLGSPVDLEPVLWQRAAHRVLPAGRHREGLVVDSVRAGVVLHRAWLNLVDKLASDELIPGERVRPILLPH